MENLTPLCRLAYEYGTDKCPQMGHTYTPYYYQLFKDRRQTVRKVLEVGIGSPSTMKHVKGYKIGASLFMWREFFPKAQIYGVDILQETIFEADRIKTFLLNERDKPGLRKLVKEIGADIDLFIDDGSHVLSDQVRTCRTVMPYLSKDTTYMIEDVRRPAPMMEKMADYDISMINLAHLYGRAKLGNYLAMVKHKHE